VANLIITIDGPAGSGKSTAARLLAKRLDAGFLDTGAMYRAVTLAAMLAGVDMFDEDALLGVLKSNQYDFRISAGRMLVSINGRDVTEEIRRPEVTANAGYIASAAKIRGELVAMQRKFAAGHEKIVTEGRDQGTVAFADASIKFFLTADPGERARRRQKEFSAKGTDLNFEQVQKDIDTRDASDESRLIGPLKPADDAVIIDTTDLDIDQVVEKLLEYVSNNG
jgi:cytidylate kinase